MTASPFDHPVLSGIFGDAEVEDLFSLPAELEGYGLFETALAAAQQRAGMISREAAEAIAAACRSFSPDAASLRDAARRDGLAVPRWVAMLRDAVPAEHRDAVHLGATSQDVIDTSLVIRLDKACAILAARLLALENALKTLETKFGGRRLMGRTRMQDALDIAAATRIAAWRAPLGRHCHRLADLKPRLLVVQLGGAVGDRARLSPYGDAIACDMAEILGLSAGEGAWHTARDGVFEFAALLVNISGSLGKFGQDVALMALSGPDHIGLSGGGGSSAMPHKSNPVDAEILVSLARFNAALLGGMGQALVHDQERSGAAWTLEWLSLPQMVLSASAGLSIALRLAGAIESIGKAP